MISKEKFIAACWPSGHGRIIIDDSGPWISNGEAAARVECPPITEAWRVEKMKFAESLLATELVLATQNQDTRQTRPCGCLGCDGSVAVSTSRQYNAAGEKIYVDKKYAALLDGLQVFASRHGGSLALSPVLGFSDGAPVVIVMPVRMP